MNETFVEQTKERLTLVLLVYPIAIGLYAVGFFWDIPRDIIGYFDIVPFFFKASIVYLSAAFAILVVFLIITMFYGPLLGLDRTASTHASGEAVSESHETWSSMSNGWRIIVAIASIGILLVAGFAAWLDPPSFKGPNRYLAILMAVFLMGFVSRPFVRQEDWRVATVIFFFTLALVIPVIAGHGDAEIYPDGPTLSVDGVECPIIFATSDTLVSRCANSFAVLAGDVDQPLVWHGN